MVRINLEMDETLYQDFKLKAGDGNMNKILRDFIKSYIGIKEGEYKEKELRKELKKVEDEKKEIDKQHSLLKSKLSTIEVKKEAEAEKQSKFMDEQKRRFREATKKTIKDNLNRVIK